MNSQNLMDSTMRFDPATGVATWGDDDPVLDEYEIQQLRQRCWPHPPNETVALTIKKLRQQGRSIDGIVSQMASVKGYSRTTVKKYYPVFNPSPK